MIKYSFDELDNMTTQELESIIDKDAKMSVKEQMDEDTLLYILGLIEERGSYDDIMPDVEEARISFLKEYLGIDEEDEKNKPEPRKNWVASILKTACIAVITTIVLFAATVTAAAAGYDPYKEIVEWTESTFGLPKNGGYVMVNEETMYDDVAWSMNSVQRFLINQGISADVIPGYLPEGYSFRAFDSAFSVGMNCIVTVGNGSDTIKLQYAITSVSVDRSYMKDDGEPEIYEVGGITHYIMTYQGVYKAIWRNGNVECAIYGVESYEELIKIINSIYE